MSIKLVLVAACALVDADGRVLLTERPAGKSMAGLWEFPGGKIEAGERPEETLIRELKEELGIVVREPCLAPLTFASHAYEDFHLLMPLYVCRRWEGIAAAQEGQRLAWVRPNRLRDYKMPPADEPLVAHLTTAAAVRRQCATKRPIALNAPAFSPAEISCVRNRSASRVLAEPGASGCCWLSCGAQPDSQTISNVARMRPSGSAKRSA